ncbi:MAG: MCP four helix bundle domain-containing protein [Calditrichaceae bacterium]|jgi:methyl-accepting chemotaxis protein
MGLRIKILSGFIILAIMLAIAGAWTIYELRSTGFSVQALLDENYRSIHAAEDMIKALEREDSAILFLMLGKWREGRALLVKADSAFNEQLKFAYTNITIPGEESRLDTIRTKYQKYKKLWERPIVDTPREGNIAWYFEQIHSAFSEVTASVQELINLNNRVMYKTGSDLKQRSNRAVMPGLIAIIAAILFTLIFNYFVNYYMVSPIIKITDRVKRFIINKTPYDLNIETHDEIANLSESISQLCEFVKSQESDK